MTDSKWDLSRLSSGERSALKRNAGIMMNASDMQALEAFYRAKTGHCSDMKEKAWFAALCMRCLWPEECHASVKTLPEILRQIYQNPKTTESTRKRCIGFLDLYWGDDGFLLGKICGLIRTIRASFLDLMPDFESLADDLNGWNYTTHYIQRKWLNIICRPREEDNKEEETTHVI